MAARKKVTDEEILAALSEHGSVSRAAKTLGVTPNAIYARLESDDLAGKWKKRQYRKLENELSEIHAGVPDAIRTLRELAEDSGPRDSVRMAAANRIIDIAIKLRDQAGGAADVDLAWDVKPDFRPRLVDGTGTDD